MPSAQPAKPRKSPKPRMARDQATYDQLVAAFREAPGNLSHVSRRTGVDRSTAKRAWEVGWPELAGARPIRDTIAAERDVARAQAQERARAEAELADADRSKRAKAIADALAQEAELMTVVRGGVLSLAKTFQRLAPAMAAVSRVILSAVVDPETGQPLAKPTITPPQAMKLLREFTTVGNRITYAEQVIVELGRLDRGESTANVVLQQDMDDDALRENLDLVADVREHLEEAAARQRGAREVH